MIIAQAGRLQYEAALLAASLRHCSPGFSGRLLVAEPQPGPLWPSDPRISDPGVRRLLDRMGAEILPFDCRHFGASYPTGNKIECLAALPPEPFLFLDSDTLVLSPLEDIPFDFTRPSASLGVSDTWPQEPLYGPDRGRIWRSLYDLAGLDMKAPDISGSPGIRPPRDDWWRYPYYNAGAFWHADPQVFGALFLNLALRIRDTPPPELASQAIYPWLDQIALPLVIHALGGGRNTLAPGHIDGQATCHYRHLPLLYAREDASVLNKLEDISRPHPVRRVLKQHPPMHQMIYRGRGRALRAMVESTGCPPSERVLRNRLRKAGFWMR